MNDVRRPPRRDAPALPTPTRLLYLAGPAAERDAPTLQQLSALTGEVQLTTVTTTAEVEQKIRAGGFHALVISHAQPQADTLHLISSLRKANAPIAIVPVVTESQRDLYASAVAVGADDVLILLGGTLLHPTETLVRVRQSRYLPPHEVEAVRAAMRSAQPAAGAPRPALVPSPRPDAVPEPLATFRAEGPPEEPPSPPRRSPPPPAAGSPGPVRLPSAPPAEAAPPLSAAAPVASASPEAGRVRELEARLSQAEADTASRREAYDALLRAKEQLERDAASQGAFRQAWDRERDELTHAARTAVAASAAAEAKLDAMRVELARLTEAQSQAEDARHAAERDRDTAAAAAGSRADLERALARAEAALHEASESHAADRLAWETARQGLERRAAQAETADAARRTAESALEAARSALAAVEQARTSERDEWSRDREALEARLHQMGGEAGAREHVERLVAAREAELTETRAALEREREAAAALRAEIARRQGDLEQLEAARVDLERALDAARAELRQSHEGRVRDEAERAVERADLERELDAARTDLRQAHEARLAAEAETSAERARLEHELEAARAGLQQFHETRASLEARVREAEASARLEHDVFEQRLAALGADLQRAIEASSADRVALEAATDQLRAQRAELAALEPARREAEEALAAARTDLEGARARADAMAAELNAAREAADRLRADLSAAQDARARSEQERQTLAEELARRSAARDEALAEAERTADALRAEAAALDAARAVLEAERQRQAEAFAAEQGLWDAARAAFEARLRDADAAADRARDLETTLGRVRDEADQVRQALDAQRLQAAEVRQQRAAAQAELEAGRQRLSELERARDAARQDVARAERAHAEALTAWEERRRVLEESLAMVTDARAAERMEWMTTRLALETRLSQVDDEIERQREDTDAVRTELARVAARYDRLARSELVGYAVTTLDGWLVHCNDAFARLLGYEHAREALASASEHAFGADGADLIGHATLVDGQVRYRDGVLTRVDGESVRVLQSAVLVTGAGMDPLVERVALDLSDRTALEERLREAQRLAQLGRLTAAMAPELDALATLLEAGISAGLDASDESEAAPPAVLGELRQLVAFARKQARQAPPLDVNDAVDRLSAVLVRLVGSHVEFAVRLGPSALIAADEEDFEQLVTALVVNARDRLTAGGSLVVETGAAEAADTDQRPAVGLRGGSGAMLIVSAAGYGVDAGSPPATLETLAARLGGSLHASAIAGRRIVFRVDLPRHR